MNNSDSLRNAIRTAIECARVYRRRRPDLARAHLSHARHLRDRLYLFLSGLKGYEVSQ